MTLFLQIAVTLACGFTMGWFGRVACDARRRVLKQRREDDLMYEPL